MNNYFIREIFDKVQFAWSHFAFKLYFLLVVIGIGGIDIFLSIWEQKGRAWSAPEEIAKNLSAYALALITTNMYELYMGNKIKSKAAFLTVAIFATVYSVFVLSSSYNTSSKSSIIFAVIGSLVGLLFWVLANYDNEIYKDDAENDFADEMIATDSGQTHGVNWQ